MRGEAEHYKSFLPSLRVQLIQILQQPILLQINLTCFSVIWYASEEVWSHVPQKQNIRSVGNGVLIIHV